MIRGDDTPQPGDLLLVSIGNTRTRVARARGGALEPSRVLDNEGIAGPLRDHVASLGDPPPALIASVNPKVADAAAAILREGGVSRIERFGADLPVPIEDALEDRSTVGQDRLLCALGAWWRTRQACIVVDAGTAITVDFVDGAGVFQGGAIAPGAGLMARILHERTAALPNVDVRTDLPGAAPFGKTTRKAIALGVASACRGMARYLIDRYAEYYEAYPTVVATGGDAPLLFEDDPLIERIVPDLPLVGMLAAAERFQEQHEADEDE